MRRSVFAAALALLVICQGTVHADPVWAGAGWYQIAYTPNGRVLSAGPYADFGSCNATLPASDDTQITAASTSMFARIGATDLR